MIFYWLLILQSQRVVSSSKPAITSHSGILSMISQASSNCCTINHPIMFRPFCEYLLPAWKKIQPASEDPRMLSRSSNMNPTTRAAWDFLYTRVLFSLLLFASIYLYYITYVPFAPLNSHSIRATYTILLRVSFTIWIAID